MTKLIVRGGSIKGPYKKKNELNEDFFLKDKKNGFFVVADGMGGHAAGDKASNYAVYFLKEKMQSFLKKLNSNQYPDEKILHQLKTGVEYTNSLIVDLAENNIHTKNFGTTLTALVVNNNKAYFGHLGDSALFLYRNKRISKLTENHHALPHDKILNGYEKLILERKAPLSKYLGKNNVEPQTDIEDLRINDILLLCSDGITKYVYEDEIAEIFERNEFKKTYSKLLNRAAHPQKMAEILAGYENISVNEAKNHFKYFEKGDNTTALILKVIE